MEIAVTVEDWRQGRREEGAMEIHRDRRSTPSWRQYPTARRVALRSAPAASACLPGATSPGCAILLAGTLLRAITAISIYEYRP
jgi:hypothetical protein